MKKKIINGIMMVALVVATSTSFVSCKDTNEDVRIEQDSKIADLQRRLADVEATYATIGYVDDKVTQAKNELQAAIDENAEQTQEALDNLDTEITQLEAKLTEAFGKLVTSVEISGTYNNMLGSINVPGFEPKMLINNWGVAADDVVFPKYDGYKGKTIIVGKGEEIGTNKDNYGFAGFIYANVNRYIDDMPLLTKAQDPKNGIFDFTIANTAGEDVKGLMVRTDGQPTTDVLRWGWTRADNNIFKFRVDYGGENAKEFAPKIDLSKFKSKFKADLKQVWADRNRQTGTSKQALGHLVADLYYNLATKDYNMKKYALKVTWKDNTAYEHMVTSEAELVFMTIMPLSFKAFSNSDDVHAKTSQVVGKVNYTVEKLEPYLDKIINRVKDKLNLGQYVISKAAFARMRIISAPSPYEYAVLIPSGTTLNTTLGITTDQDVYVDVTDIVKSVEGAVDSMNNLLGNMQDLLDKVQASTVTNWVEKFTNKAGTLFENNADQMLQPVLLAIDKDGNVSRVSGLENAPYEANGEITLEPTTYTAELFAPCYAKFLGCKDIEEAGIGFNEIIYTNDKEIKFKPDSGKTYEIVYQALDFSGNVVEHSYYIQGK